MQARFLVAVGAMTPTMMCEYHARAFERLMLEHEQPHTIYELEDEDGEHECHACDLKATIEEAERPRIILPN